MDWSRRRLLAAAPLALPLAGCTAGSSDPPETATGTDADAPTRIDGRLALPSVDAPGSPGDRLPISRPGRVSVVEFFATWCKPCEPQMAELRAVRERFSTDELWLTSVTQELRPERIREFWTTYDGTWPALIDRNLRANAAYDVPGLPTTVVLTPDGTVDTHHVGGPWGREAIAEAVQAAMG